MGLLVFVPIANFFVYPFIAFHDGWEAPNKFGLAIGLMLPHVIRFNGEQFCDWYRELLLVTGGANGYPHPDRGPEGLAEFVPAVAAGTWKP